MVFKRIQSIKLRIALWASFCLVFSALVIVAYSVTTARSMAIKAAEETVLSEARIQAGIVKAEIEVALDTARARAHELTAIKQAEDPLSISRDQVNAMMRQVLVENPQYIGVWTLWEPNAFDGKDAQFANTPAYGKSGRYFPYWNRGTGSIRVEPIVGSDTGDWYQVPKRTRQEYITGLYEYPVMGEDVLMISVVAPIVANGVFYGVAGEDIPAAFLQKIADRANLKEGLEKLYIVSHQGQIAAANGQAALVGKPLSRIFSGKESEEYLNAIQSGKEQFTLTNGHLEAIVPIYFGQIPEPWAALVSLPTDVVMAPANLLMWRLIGLSFAMMLFGVTALWLVARRIAQPICRITEVARQMAAGDLTQTVAVGTGQDELSSLANAFNHMTRQLRGVHGALEQRVEELKRTSQSLRESEGRYRAIYRDNPSMFFTLDQELRIISVNQFGASQLGYSIGELEGQPVLNLFPESTHQSMTDKFHLCLQHPWEVFHWQIRKSRKDGSLFWVEAYVRAVSNEEQALQILIVCEDITERRRLEEQLRHSQKLEGMGQLAGGVAHDFNNLLTVITGYGSMLRSELGEDDPRRSNLEQILKATEHASELTRSLLVFSRKQAIAPKNVNLNEIIRNVEKFLIRVIGEDILLRSVLEKAPLWVFADSSQLEQVLINLATNARDAMPGGGQLSIETHLQVLDEAFVQAHGFGNPGRFAVIFVSDTGIGMSEEVQRRLFEPFFTTKEVGKGTGLGLSIVFGVIKQHNGYINVYSEPGKGTTFRIYLPLAETGPNHLEESGALQPPTGGTETILVAEDDPALGNMMKLILAKHGYEVILASDGQEAVAAFEANIDRIDLVLMDTIMPKRSGLQAFAEIRKLRPAIKVLFTTGYSADIIEGRDDFPKGEELIIKPIRSMELVRKIREMLDRNGGPRP